MRTESFHALYMHYDSMLADILRSYTDTEVPIVILKYLHYNAMPIADAYIISNISKVI